MAQPTNADVQQQLLCLHADITTSFHRDWSSHSSASVKAKELFKLGHHQQFPSDAHPAATRMNSLFMCLSEQAATFPMIATRFKLGEAHRRLAVLVELLVLVQRTVRCCWVRRVTPVLKKGQISWLTI